MTSLPASLKKTWADLGHLIANFAITYFASRIQQRELIGRRPSDAIALAVTAKVPIYVAEDVLGEVCGE